MKKIISIEVNIPEGYEYLEFRAARTGEYYLDTLTSEVQTASIDTTQGAESDRPFIILKEKERIRRTFELVDSSGIAEPGDFYSHLVNSPVMHWCFTTKSKAYFFIWKEIEQEKKKSKSPTD